MTMVRKTPRRQCDQENVCRGDHNLPADARKLAFGSALRLGNTVATALVSVLIMPFVVHTLGDRMYGVWTLVGTFIGYYGVLELGLSNAVSRYLAKSLGAGDEEDCNRIFNTSLRLYLGLGTVAFLISALIAAMASWLCGNTQDAYLFSRIILILGLSIGLMFPVKVFKGALEGHMRFEITAGLDLLSLLLRTALIVPVLLAGYGILGLAWVTFLTSLPSVALHIYFTHKHLPFLRFDSRYWGRSTARLLLSYSAFSLIAQLADILQFRLDAFVVAGFVGVAAVTHYKIAGVLTQYFFDLMSALMGVLPSIFSRQDGAQKYEALQNTFFFASKLAVCIASFIGFALIAWGKVFIWRWMGPQYDDAYPILLILVLGCTVALWQGPSISLLYGTSRHKVFALFNSIEGLANLALSLVLVRSYGMIGVALGTLISKMVVKIFIQPIYVCRVAGINYLDYVGRTARTLATVAGSLVVPMLLSVKFAAPDYRILFALGLLSIVCYAVPLWLFEFSTGETRLLQQAIWPRIVVRKGAQ